MAKCARVAGLWMALALFSGSARAGGYDLTLVALDGRTAPDAGGATFTAVDTYGVDINASGEVAYGAMLSGATPTWGVFVHAGGGGSARAISGDPAPPPLGGSYVAFAGPNIDDAGDVSVAALIRLPSSAGANALVLATGTGDSILVSELDVAPVAGGTLEVAMGDTNFHARGSGGAPVFQSNVIGGSASEGVFVGTASAVALAGTPSPVGGTYLSFDHPGASASGVVAFPASLGGASSAAGLFVDAGSGVEDVALAGELDPLGETYLNFAFPRVNAGGDVMFLAGWPPDGTDGGIYVDDAAGTRSVVRTGQAIPGTGGGSIEGLGGVPGFADTGAVSFGGSIVGGSVPAGVFVAEANGVVRHVALAGDPVPGAPGDSFQSFGSSALNAAGQVVFGAVSSAGAAGVFLASPAAPPVPALSSAGLGALAGLIAATTAALLLGRGDRRAS